MILLPSFTANGKKYTNTFGDSYKEAALDIYNRGEKLDPDPRKTNIDTFTRTLLQAELDWLESVNGKRCF